MSKRGEHIHKRKDGRWEGRYKKGSNESGKTIYASVYGKTYAEVKSKMFMNEMLLTEQKKFGINMVAVREKTFGEAANLWIETNRAGYKGATEIKYEYLIKKHILSEFGNMPLSQITSAVLGNYMNQKLTCGRIDKRGGLSVSYVRSIMMVLIAVINYAVSEQMCVPIKTPVNMPPIQKKESATLDRNEQKRLEKELMREMNATSLGIILSLHTGLRIGEVCALRWSDIDFDMKIIRIRATIARVKNKNPDGISETMLIVDRPKTKSSVRDIPISSKLMPLLVSMKKTAKSAYVISDSGEFVSPRTYEYRFHRILDSCGIKNINYHILRHTFATRCVEAGVEIKTLSEILGHSNVSITLNTYVHSSMDLKRIQLEKLSFISI